MRTPILAQPPALAPAKLYLFERERAVLELLGSFASDAFQLAKIKITDPAAFSASLTRLAVARITGVPFAILLAHSFDMVWLADDAQLPADAQHGGRFEPPSERRLVLLS